MDSAQYPLSYSNLFDYLKGGRKRCPRALVEVANGVLRPGTTVRGFYLRRKAKEVQYIDDATLEALVKALADLNLLGPDPRKETDSWMAFEEHETFELESGDASRGEIQIVQRSERGNILRPKRCESCESYPSMFEPLGRKYVQVYVDDVIFRQRDENGLSESVAPREGRYIRIQPPPISSDNRINPGGIGLPVDVETGDVLLCTQYRHPQRRFLTEAPRGFANNVKDKNPRDTFVREMLYETGAFPIMLAGGKEDLHPLKPLFTDTGKLLEGPWYFIAFVDRKKQKKVLNEQEPLMESPVWVGLPQFYEAVFSQIPIDVVEGEDFEFTLLPKWQRKLRFKTDSPLKNGKLLIEDAFTTSLAMLALPLLTKRFSEALDIKNLLSKVAEKANPLIKFE